MRKYQNEIKSAYNYLYDKFGESLAFFYLKFFIPVFLRVRQILKTNTYK